MKKEYLIAGGIGLVVLFIYLKGKGSTTSQGTSIANAINNPNAPVTSMGHVVDQGLPLNQQTPNEPGTAPIIGGQYA